jgi:hypothetical protein
MAGENTKVYFPQGGASMEVANNGSINIAEGGGITLASGAGIVYNGALMGFVKSGTVTLDGTNPTPVTTGLTTITTAVATIKQSTTPGDDPVCITVDYSGGDLNIYAWKNNGTDPTLVASTNSTATIDWIAVGS